MLLVLIVLCTCFNGCVANNQKIHQTTAKSADTSVFQATDMKSQEMEFHANNFFEEQTESTKANEYSKTNIRTSLKNVKKIIEDKIAAIIKSVRLTQSKATVSVKNQILQEVNELEKTLAKEKKLAFKRLDDQVKKYMDKLQKVSTIQNNIIKEENTQKNAAKQSMETIKTKASDSFRTAQNTPQEKVQIKTNKNGFKQQARSVKSKYIQGEHNRRKILKSNKQAIATVRKEAATYFAKFKSDLLNKIKKTIESSKTKIKSLLNSAQQSKTNSKK
ncbi:Uncharacterized protein QTN25_002637 [Entamoeba marina]